MNTQQQYILEALMRSQAFLDAHDDVVGPLKDTAGRKQLDAAVVELLAQMNTQVTADNAIRGVMARQGALVTELKEQHMQPIARFARAKLRGVPDFAALARSGSNLRGMKLVTAARAMATAAATVVDVLTASAFPSDVVPQLGAAADAVAKAITDRATEKRDRVVATASMRHQLSLGREGVAMLDPIVTKRLASNSGLLAGWRQAKRVVRKNSVASAPALPPVHVTPPQPVGSAVGETSTSSLPAHSNAA